MHTARCFIEAAYRYAGHEPGTDIVLFDTGNDSPKSLTTSRA